MTTFELALKFTLFEEGGYSDNPHDHGGATNFGITQATYDEWRIKLGRPQQPVKFITLDEAKSIYHLDYWLKGRCPVLSEKLSIAHFDWCVNHGVTGAIMTLQKAVGVTADGLFGPITNTAINKADQSVLLNSYLELRRQWYYNFVKRDPSQNIFLNGWLNRIIALKKYLENL